MAERNRGALEAERAFIMVIDIQERLVQAMPQELLAGLTKKLEVLAVLAEGCGLSSVVTEQYPKGLGPTWPAARPLLQGGRAIEKLAFSALGEPRVSEALPQGRDQVLVCGMEAHICVLQTVLDLLASGREVHVAADAITSRARLDWELGCRAMAAAGAQLTTVESFAFRCLGAASHPAFKAVSRAIR